jgi:hypothetical protein
MIIWRGWGVLSIVILIGAAVAIEFISEAIAGNDQFYNNNSMMMPLAFFIGGILNYIISQKFFRSTDKVVIDKETGEETTLRKSHTLFFIPMVYWSFIFIALGVVGFFVEK